MTAQKCPICNERVEPGEKITVTWDAEFGWYFVEHWRANEDEAWCGEAGFELGKRQSSGRLRP